MRVARDLAKTTMLCQSDFLMVKKPPVPYLVKLGFLEESGQAFHHQASLTAYLKTLCPDDFRLEIVKMTTCLLPLQFGARFGIVSTPVLVRDVYLCCGKIKVVFARSFLPLSTLKGYWRCLKRLDKPLGEVLFQHSNIRREHVTTQKIAYPKPCLGRFLIFRLPTGPILVTEWLALKNNFSTPSNCHV